MLVIKNKKKFITGILTIITILIAFIYIIYFIVSSIISLFNKQEKVEEQVTNNITNIEQEENVIQASTQELPEVLKQWNLKLVNKDNSVSRDYVPELEEIDDGIMFDKRALPYLEKMINAMYKEKITGIWIASAYRSYDKQEELFNNKVKYYKDKGKTQEEAEKLAQTIVQRPEMSEHNLGLAADFNTVTNDFEDTKAFKWLKENAQDYGFILRYPKDKQEITGISYESWHWRYVGVEHAKIINQKGYCLEEYIEYLKGTEHV